jgi:hypothetical protein
MTELLKLHPIGSDVNDLVKTLEKAGAVNSTPKTKEQNGGYAVPENITLYRYRHISIESIFYKQWSVSFKYDHKNKIKKISVFFNYNP